MATQYSNKPIVTDGLVYALDFGNPKSYVSGSGTAFNLKYSPITSSVTTYGTVSLPSIVDNLARFTKNGNDQGTTINTGLTNHPIVYNGTFTLLYIGQGGPNEAASYLVGAGTSTLPLIAFSKIEFDASGYYTGRSYPVNSNLKFVAVVHNSGSYERYENGLPIPPTGFTGGSYSPGGSTLRISGRSATELFFTGSLGCVLLYNRKLSADEIWQNYQILAPKYGLSVPSKPYTLDPSAYLFLSQSGITDPIITSSINTFVLGLKSASLWDKMVGIYPFVGTGSAGINLTGSHRWNLKEPSTATYGLIFTGTWIGSTSGSAPSGSNTNITIGQVTPRRTTQNAASSLIDQNNVHISFLSYDTPVSRSYLMGTGMTEDLAVSTLAGDYGTPAAAYSVRKVRTAYTGALMDVRRSYDNVTSSIGFVSNGDLDTGSLLDWVVPGRNTLPGAYSGLAAAYSLRRVSASYAGSVIDVRRDSDNTTGSVGFDINGNLDTGSLLAFVTGSAGTGSGFVAQWYDQSGNNRHATQTITGSQPLIVSSGSLVTSSGRPTIDFSNGYKVLQSDNLTVSQPYTTFTYVNYRDVSNFPYIFDHGTERGVISLYNAGGGHRFFAGNVVYFGGLGVVNTPYLYYALFNTANSQASVNGVLTSSVDIGNVAISRITIGGSSTGVSSQAYISEHIEYHSDQSANRPLIENNINNYYNIYTGSNHGFVARWYDQSGNNRHATQTATGSQPIIVLSGSVVSSGTRPSLYWDASGTSNLEFSRISNIQTVFHTSQLLTTTSQSFLLGDTTFFDYHAGTGDPQTWFSSNPPVEIRTSPNNYINGIQRDLNFNSTYYRNLDRNLITLIHTSAIGRANRISEDRSLGFGRTWRGYIQEITLYTSSQVSNREPIEYGINSYYNIYPQTSSFATSSFTISAASGSVSASLNNRLTSGISTSGPLGLITVSRTGSNSLTIARNGVTSSFAVPASGALSTGIYLGAINNNGIALGNSPLNISFASVGTGLTNRETQLLFNNVTTLRYNLGTTVDPEYRSVLSYARTQGFTLPSVQQQSFQNKLIIDLKQAGIWQKLDAFYLYATNGDSNYANINWKNPGVFPTVPGAGTILTPNVGLTPTTSFSVPYVTNLPGSNFITSSGCFYYYDYFSAVSLTVLSSGGTNLRNRNSFGFNEFRMNDVVSTSGGYSLSGFRALKSIQFNSPNQLKITNQKTQYTITASGTSLTLYGVGNSMIFYGPSQHSLFAYGASLLNENSDFVDAIDNYFTAISL